MDWTQLANAITTVGFPIVCVVMLWRYVTTTQKELTDVIRANTEVLRRIEGKMEEIDND